MYPPFFPDPGWYERHWYGERPQPRRRRLPRGMARLAVLMALLAGSGLVLARHHVHREVSSGLQDWERE